MSDLNTAFPVNLLPLAAAQPGIWMADKLSDCLANLSVAHFTELNGIVDAGLLVQAIVKGMSEADTLKMRYIEQDGIPWQWTDEKFPFDIPQVIDLRGYSDPENTARQLMEQDRQQDLRLNSHQPLYYHCLMQVNDQRWFWYQRYHHLIVDGFSFTAITRRIASIYSALCQGRQPSPSPFSPFTEVIEEYQRYQNSPERKRDADFWRQRIERMPPALTLSDKPFTITTSYVTLLRHQMDFDMVNFTTIDKRLRAEGLTTADTILALISLWAGRISNQQDFSLGFVFMRRIGSAALCATGPVLNILPYEVHIAAEMTFTQLSHSLAKQMKLLRRYQRYDAEQIQRDIGLTASQQPLSSVIVNLKLFDYHLDFNGIPGITHQLASGPVHDLEIAICPVDQKGIKIEILARSDRYDSQQLEQHCRRINLLLEQFAANPDLPCSAASILHQEEQQLFARINNTKVILPDITLSEAIARQAQKTPYAVSLADEMYQFTYQTMREQVVALAVVLRQHGVRSGDIVAVALPRSVFLSLALQAIVETGAAWLPLDTGYPDARLQMMLTDAAPRLLITSSDQLTHFNNMPDLEIYCYNTCLPPVNQTALLLSRPEHTAYVIYTSGSTGRPKGVMISQAAIMNRLLWMQHQYPLQNTDVVLQKTPCSFDVSVWEFFWPLMCGARLIMAPPDAHRDPLVLQQLFTRWQVTTTHFVPSMLAAFISTLTHPQAVAHCQPLKQVFCSGEALPVTLCRDWQRLTGIPLHNLYGPTEAAVDVSWHPAYGDALAEVTGNNVPIGRPVWNTQLRVLDVNLQPLPPGVAGHLYLTGRQLAQGYLFRQDLTANRFVTDPASPETRMYHTGDIARWLTNGVIEYLGRSDDQIKLRGQRIELTEIASVLQNLPGVASAVVVARVLSANSIQDGDMRQLVGYWIAQPGSAPDTNSLYQQLQEILPSYMLPVALVMLEELPLSVNGKLDPNALPLPEFNADLDSGAAHERPPEKGIESIIAQAFGRLLECEIVSVHQDFFASGGHSLLAMRLAAELQRSLNQPVHVGQIMVASTIASLAQALSQKQGNQEENNAGFETVLPLRTGSGAVLFCIHPASGFAWQFSLLPRYLDAHWSIIGIQSVSPGGAMQQTVTIDQLAEHHLHILRSIQSTGPWYLLGYSLGGTLAQAIAAKLEKSGEQVAFLGLLDTWPAETQNWANKDANQLDPQVLAEINREREAFLNAHQGQSSDRLFTAIEDNYADAVRLLTTAHSYQFSGRTTLFAARSTMPDGVNPQQAWKKWIAQLDVYTLNCSHAEIMSAEQFLIIGPIINDVLNQRILNMPR